MISKSPSHDKASLTVLGDGTASGTYILRITAHADIGVTFGRFQGGRLFSLPAGHYLYIGSAMGGRLAARLLRHATRTPGKPPHSIRTRLEAHLAANSLPIPRLSPKRLHWHIDFLLDNDLVELNAVLAIRSDTRLEERLADRVAHLAGIGMIHPGLGASDCSNQTHLLTMGSPEIWHRICQIVSEIASVKIGPI